MEFKKNDLVTVKIEDMGHDGEGIGKAEGYTLFIKDTVIGDVVEAKIMKMKKNYGYARLVRVLAASKDRTEPKCSVARACGGCQLQFLTYEKQLEFKKNKVVGNLERIGGFSDISVEKVMGMENPWRYRNKAQFPVGKDKEGNLITGFYAGRTHSIIPNTNCYLGVEVNEEILNAVLNYMRENHVEPYDEVTGKGLVRHILIRYGFKTKEIMVCIIINGRKIPNAAGLVESGIYTAGLERFLCFWHRRHKKFMVWKSFRQLLKMQEKMQRLTALTMRNFLWVRQKKFCLQNIKKMVYMQM